MHAVWSADIANLFQEYEFYDPTEIRICKVRESAYAYQWGKLTISPKPLTFSQCGMRLEPQILKIVSYCSTTGCLGFCYFSVTFQRQFKLALFIYLFIIVSLFPWLPVIIRCFILSSLLFSSN